MISHPSPSRSPPPLFVEVVGHELGRVEMKAEARELEIYRNGDLEPESVSTSPKIASHVHAAVYPARQRLKLSLLIKGMIVAETEGFEPSIPLWGMLI